MGAPKVAAAPAPSRPGRRTVPAGVVAGLNNTGKKK